MKASLRHVDDHGHHYEALMFVCPGCATPYTFPDGTEHTPSGVHMLPVSGDANGRPVWTWDGNLEAPTLSPSIATKIHPYDEQSRPLGFCHSYLRGGVFEFLTDSTHKYSGQHVPMPDLPRWAEDDDGEA